jgi:hypothetical protein
MPIAEIENVRDLLVAVIGGDLMSSRTAGHLDALYSHLTPDEAVVAWVLDTMTLHSLKLLVKLRESQGWTDEATH